MKKIKYNKECRFFKGDMPCVFHKKEGVHCTCVHYEDTKERILIIKLGAAGDVIRTTPLLKKIKETYPKAIIDWLTDFPDLVPKSYVNRVIKFNSPEVFYILANEYDILYALDKDYSAVSIAKLIKAKTKKGFILKAGRPASLSKAAEEKILTGLFDDVNKANTKNYMQEIFEICGFSFNNEEYIVELRAPEAELNLPPKKKYVVGLNTGCGRRWSTRLWAEENWEKLAKTLIKSGLEVVLLGGKEEDELNIRLAKKTGAFYPGTFSLNDFLHVVNYCDLVVTQVTMAMHIAIGLKKKMVLMNNAFNRNEFFLYGLGNIVEPQKDCLGCFKGACEEECMSLLSPEKIAQEVISLKGE